MSDTSPKLTPCIFHVPLAYNKKEPVAQDRLDRLLDRIYAEFGGYTIEGTVKGTYRRRDTGKKDEECHLKVKVSVCPEEIEHLKQMVREIGGELEQETMYFEVMTGSSAELLPSVVKKGGE